MRSRNKNGLRFALLAMVLLVSSTAPSSAMTVFDPANWLENWRNAITQIKSYNQMIRDYLLQYQEYMRIVNAYRGFDRRDLEIMLGIDDLRYEYQSLKRLYKSVGDATGSVQWANRRLEKLYKEYRLRQSQGLGNASTVSDFLGESAGRNSEHASSRARDARAAIEAAQQDLKELEAQIRAYNRRLAATPEGQGSMRIEMQKLNAAVSMLVKQNSRILSVYAAQSAAQADTQSLAKKKEEIGQKALEDYLKASKEQLNDMQKDLGADGETAQPVDPCKYLPNESCN